MSRIGTLGSAEDSILLDHNASVTLLPDGRFIAAPTSTPGTAAEFDSIGAPAKAFGRRGDGPGESGMIRGAYTWTGDSALLLESFRFTFLAGPRGTGRSATYTAVNFALSAAPLPADGLIVVDNKSSGTEQFVVLGSQGEKVRGMGMPRNTGESYSRDAVVAPALRPHAFWAGATRYRHRFELWDVNGSRLRSFDEAPAWFVPYDSAQLAQFIRQGDQAMKPWSYLKGLRETRDGTLLALFGVAAEHWVPHKSATDTGRLGELRHKPGHRSAYGGMLEAIDATTGHLLVAEHLSLPVEGFINDTLAYDRPQSPDGIWQLVIYRMTLRRGSGGTSSAQ